ncbi:hypothetical protein, partial [Paralcaligenes ginsengisoli]
APRPLDVPDCTAPPTLRRLYRKTPPANTANTTQSHKLKPKQLKNKMTEKRPVQQTLEAKMR